MPAKRTPDEQREYERTRKREYRARKAAERERHHQRERVADAPTADGESIDGARRRRAIADADRAEIARDVSAGRLVDRETVIRTRARGLAAVRSALETLPRTIAAIVEPDHRARVRELVETEIDGAVEGLRVALAGEVQEDDP